MKKVLALAVAAFFTTGLMAQQNELEMFQSMYKIEKKALLMDFLQLEDEQAKIFWPIYEEYESERTKNANRRIELIKKYAEEYETLTDEQADALAKESFAVRATRDKLHKKYYNKVKKALGAKRAAQFIQFERFVANAMDSKLNDSLPLIGEKF
jgi:Spy/CpxP family protein refolding chaperone